MISILSTLQNFGLFQPLKTLFHGLSNSYEYSENGVLRYTENPKCIDCGSIMNQNGYNIITKRHIGSIKVGKYLCPICNTIHHTDVSFWKEQNGLITEVMGKLLMCLKNSGDSYRRMAQISGFILPFKKSTMFSKFSEIVELTESTPSIPQGKIAILNFDEEYLKIAGKWRYRLTLLNYKTKIPIAEKVVKNLTNEIIRDFLKSSFNPAPYEKIFVVTDLKPGYKEILKSLFGEKLIHQYCIFHLYQLICKEFSKSSSLSEFLLQYKLMNIFYDYEMEVLQIEKKVHEEKKLNELDKKELKCWIKIQKEELYAYFFNSRNNDSKKLRDPVEAYYKMLQVAEEYDELPVNIQKRIDMIDDSILNFLAYRSIPDAPATNNAIEGYFSVTTNPILKRQMKTIEGAERSIKSYAIERTSHYLIKKGTEKVTPQITLLELIIPLRILGNPI
ncbi:hypothetical protein ACKUB1_01500 [Methanospirillum stamsii]|nr:hypothetical protein [Methanospirillum stamsii]